MKAIVYSAISAIIIQPFFFFACVGVAWLMSGESLMMPFMLVVAMAVAMVAAVFVLMLGVPSFLVLRFFNRASVPWLSSVGFLLPAVPLAVMLWPGNDRVVPVDYWFQCAQAVVLIGLQGLLSALVFLHVWRKTNSGVARENRHPRYPASWTKIVCSFEGAARIPVARGPSGGRQ